MMLHQSLMYTYWKALSQQASVKEKGNTSIFIAKTIDSQSNIGWTNDLLPRNPVYMELKFADH